MSYLLHVIVLINLIAVLALSLNIVVGFTGLLSVCHTAFFAIGAYSTAILLLKFHWDWSATCLAAISVTLLVAFVVGRFLLRFRDDWVALGTFIFQLMLFRVLENWTPVTGGALGLSGIPRPEILGWTLSSDWSVAAVSTGFSIAIAVWLKRIATSSFGYVLLV